MSHSVTIIYVLSLPKGRTPVIGAFGLHRLFLIVLVRAEGRTPVCVCVCTQELGPSSYFELSVDVCVHRTAVCCYNELSRLSLLYFTDGTGTVLHHDILRLCQSLTSDAL